MSQPSSDFDTADIGFDEAYPAAPTVDTGPPAPQYRQRGFSIYTVMLIISFVFLATSAILLFINGDKY